MGTDRPTYDDLLAIIARRDQRSEASQAEVARLRAELDGARRAAKRHAAPFAKRERLLHRASKW